MTSFLAVSSILLLIVVSNSFARFLGRAASGALDPDVLFWIILYRIPASLELIFPLSLFLAAMLVVGRMYMDNEVSVLFATGTSEKKLASWILFPALIVTLLVGYISADLAPRSTKAAHAIFAEQKERSAVDQLVPGRFLNLRGSSSVVYTQSVNDGELTNVFYAAAPKDGVPSIMVAPRATQIIREGQRYLVLRDGHRYDVEPGKLGGTSLDFVKQGILIPTVEVEESSDIKAKTSWELISSNDLEDKAMLHYRIALTLMVPIMTLIAVSLGRTNPRSGRYARLLPGILLFLLYLVLINAAKSAIEAGTIPSWLGMWWIHGAYAIFAWWTFNSVERQMKRNARRTSLGVV